MHASVSVEKVTIVKILHKETVLYPTESSPVVVASLLATAICQSAYQQVY